MRAATLASLALALGSFASPVSAQASRGPDLRAPGTAAPTPGAFGTGNSASYEVTPFDFSPTSSSIEFEHPPGPLVAALRSSTPYATFFASPALPAGARLLSMDVEYCNGNPPGGDDILIQLVDTDAQNDFLSTLGSVDAPAGDVQCPNQKAVDLSGLGYTVDNASHRLLVFVIFGPNPPSSALVATGSITISYRLQISPPPDSPTFNDVPTTDPGFPYIEALAASGISAGCGGGKFCPDSAVTRRQMAVFLSKALGLSHNFGTTNPIYVAIPEWQFWPLDSSVQYEDTGAPLRSRFPTGGGGFATDVSLPAGALLDAMEFQYCDDRLPGSQPFALILHDRSQQDLGIIQTVPGQGCTSAVEDLSGLQYTVGDFKLFLSIVFGSPSGTAESRFQGAAISYRLQVSPAPAPATFGDVPTTDAGFRYIEALAASGITGGCGGGNFCPGNPVTRRQMAVFLAKALGLSYN
jgi:hypothetical protein